MKLNFIQNSRKFFTRISLIMAVFQVSSAHAGIVLQSLTQDDLDGIHQDIASLMVFSTGADGGPIPGEKPFKFQLGVLGGIGTAENILAETEDAGETNPIPAILPNIYFFGGAGFPGGLSVEFNWRPNFSRWLGLGFNSAYYAGGVRWSVTELLSIPLLNLDIGANYGIGGLSFDQTLNGLAANNSLDRTSYGAGVTAGLNLDFFLPYIHLGWSQSDVEITTTNIAAIFNPSLSTTDKAKSKIDTLVGRVGANLKFNEGSIGLEYQQAFYAHRVMFRASSHF